MCPHGEPRPCVRALEEQARRDSDTTPQLVIKDELLEDSFGGAPCARLTSPQYNLTPICLRSLVLGLVVQAISPAAQFLGEPP
jgi:hypothetical protein